MIEPFTGRKTHFTLSKENAMMMCVRLLAVVLALSWLGSIPEKVEAAPKIKACTQCGQLHSGSVRRGTYQEYTVTPTTTFTSTAYVAASTYTYTEPVVVVRTKPIRQFVSVLRTTPQTTSMTTVTTVRCTGPNCASASQAVLNAVGPDGQLETKERPVVDAAGPPK